MVLASSNKKAISCESWRTPLMAKAKHKVGFPLCAHFILAEEEVMMQYEITYNRHL